MPGDGPSRSTYRQGPRDQSAIVCCTTYAEALADRALVNQADAPELLAAARELAGGLDVPVVAGSLRAGRLMDMRG